MYFLAALGFFAVVSGQSLPTFVLRPNNTWAMPQFNDAFGSFDSHPGYPNMPYGPANKTRYVITTPEGTQAKLTIDASDTKNFCIRSYDYAVIFNCDDNLKIVDPCSVSPTTSYATPLTPKDTNYVSVTATSNAVRELTAKNNRICMDWCISVYDSSADVSATKPCRMGFRAYWQSVGTATVPAAGAGAGPVPVVEFAANPRPGTG